MTIVFGQLANALLYNSAVQPIYFDDVDSTITTSITMGWGATMVRIFLFENCRFFPE